ncbi:MAG: hypothetical protein A3H70_01990 [Candidatus Komeilibacteria bacterium RIFCSPLOWO2_02_FULL_48_11]|uniref:Glycosyl transferase family 1 domain-containing protein n=1 Tax=Candidatus Komeilibacteria bacterium RIFCSPLOWO2_02_FULL_48_11 TaxID=1798553 RepID=A0A1G2BSF2_9BACT|nr:MAG: hypothetical protein A3H70_01990 [Candidatus Komeilibacteria bacterium RIFCSPLOWO2_02_FULL_48_11]
MKYPRVLFCSGIFPPAIGGPGAVLTKLIPGLIEAGFACTVATFGPDDKIARNYAVERVTFSTPKPWRLLRVLGQIWRLARQNDIIYATDTYTHGLAALLVSKLRRKKLIIRFTGDSAWEAAFNQGLTQDYIVPFQKKWYGPKIAFRKWLRKQILKGADRIITDCEFLKNLLGIIGVDKNKVSVINNAVELLSEADSIKNFGEHVLLTQGRLVPWKGITAIIDAVPLIQKQFSDAKLLIMGDGPEEEKLKLQVTNYKLQDSVIFLGKVTDKKQKKAYYQASRIFVLNTFYEGMSNTLSEAMSEELPVITTMAGGNPEFVDDNNGRLVEYNNIQQIASAVIELLASPELAKKLGESGRERARKFTIERLVEKNINVISRPR